MNIDPEAIQAFIEALVALIESCQPEPVPEPVLVTRLRTGGLRDRVAIAARANVPGVGLFGKLRMVTQLQGEIRTDQDARDLLAVVGK